MNDVYSYYVPVIYGEGVDGQKISHLFFPWVLNWALQNST